LYIEIFSFLADSLINNNPFMYTYRKPIWRIICHMHKLVHFGRLLNKCQKTTGREQSVRARKVRNRDGKWWIHVSPIQEWGRAE
jgi:hypothetical protein